MKIGIFGFKDTFVEKLVIKDVDLVLLNLDGQDDIEKLDFLLVKPVKDLAEYILTGYKSTRLINLEKIAHTSPHKILDIIDNILLFVDRSKICKLLENIDIKYEGERLRSPKYVINTDDISKLKFPVVCKPLIADGPVQSHDCYLAFTVENLKLLNGKMIYQEFHNHDGVIHKIYVIGDKIYTFMMASIPNLSDETDLKHIGRISKSKTNNYTRPPSINLIRKFVSEIKPDDNKITMIGIDIIRSNNDGSYYVIDINYIPSYNGISNVGDEIIAHLKEQIRFVN